MVVDDDADIANLIGEVLRDGGYVTRVVSDSRQALDAFEQFQPALVTLDVMMPSVDGISLCLQLRKSTDVPILFLSAKKDPPDRVVGLRIGADDYLGKPFDNDELVARVEALLRRSRRPTMRADDTQLRFGRFVIDLASVQAIAGDKQIALTPTEFKLIRTLAAEPGRVMAAAAKFPIAGDAITSRDRHRLGIGGRAQASAARASPKICRAALGVR